MKHDLEPPPAVRQIETDRDDVLAIDIVGRVRSSDIENAYGLLQAACQLHDRIDLLVRFSGYEGCDWEAAFNRTTMRGKLAIMRHVRRYAVVGAPGWIRIALLLSRPLVRFRLRHFDLQAQESAWRWIEARPLRGRS